MIGASTSRIDSVAASAPNRSSTAQPDVRRGCPAVHTVTGRLVALIERDGLSVAAAARAVGVDVAVAGRLVRLWAIECECAEIELEERLEDIQHLCPGEDWWSYSERQLHMIASGESIPTRIVRELVLAWQRRTGQPTSRLAAELGISRERLRRSLGLVVVSGRYKSGRRYRAGAQKTIRVDAAERIVTAIGIPPCEVPGL